MSATPRLLSDCEGSITRVVACLPGRLASEEPALAGALLAAPPGRLTVVTHRASREIVRRLAPHRDLDLVVVADETPLTVWTQDALVAYAAEGALLAPSRPAGSRTPARALFDALAGAGVAVREADGLPIRSGNVLAGGDRLLVGADEWRRIEAEAQVAPASFVAARIDGTRAPLLLGGGSGLSPGPARPFVGPDGARWFEDAAPGVVERDSLQAIAHVDLAVALLGTGRDGTPEAAVGDPRLARQLAGTPAPGERCRGFDQIATALQSAGVRVVRLPLPFVAEDDPARRRRAWHILPYPNVLVDCDEKGRRRVVMPAYGEFAGVDFSAADRFAAATLEALGIAATMAPGLGYLARRGGGLRCALKVAERR